MYYLSFKVKSSLFEKNTIMVDFFNKLHLAFVKLKKGEKCHFGVSFPSYDLEEKTTGDTIRVFAENGADLESLRLLLKFQEMEVSEILEVPATHNWVCFKKQTQESPSRHKRSKNPTKYVAKQLQLPFLTVRSYSTKRKFMLFLKRETKELTDLKFEYNFYGLSGANPVPDF